MSQTFGRYTVLGELGRGAMGVVYLASDPMLNRQVAVKTVDLGVDDPEEREFLRTRLLRDARAAAVLKHPNIVAVYDVFEDGARAYVVMEYVEGDSLAARLKAGPAPDAATILRVLRQMADALDYTHARGVIHRDIKPGNVMIDSAGTAKIMDFGIARITDTRTCTPTGMVMGTVEYMAPEQILGEELDGRADQFALAVVAYQMMTGSTLFGPNSIATLTYKIVHETPMLPCTRNAALPRGVDAVLAKALAKKPGERFATCSEFAGALAQAFSDAPTAPLAPPVAVPVAVAPTGQTTVASPRPVAVAEPAGNSRAAVVVAAIAVLVLGGALAAVIWKPWNRTPPPPPAAVAAVTPSAPAATPVPKKKKAVAEPVVEPKTGSKPETESKPEVHPVELPRVVSEPAKIEPPKAEPPKAEPPKAVSPPPAATTPSTVPKPVAAPEPVEEVELPPLPPEPKTGAAPSPFTLAMQQGQQQVKANDYPGAIQTFTKAISLRRDSAPAYNNRGAARQHLEQFEMAIQDFSEAVRLDPKMVHAYVGWGGCLVRLKRDPEALVEFQRALELKPDAVLALSGRGAIYLRRKQYNTALADFDKALSIDPRFGPAYLNRAHAREAIGDLAGAAADRRAEAALHKK